MLLNKLIKNTFIGKMNLSNSLRAYTVVVERCEEVPLLKMGRDPRSYPLKSKHIRYKFVECKHTQKWGEVDLILTEYVEGN